MEKVYDLEKRTEGYAIEVIRVSKRFANNIANVELARQLVRAVGSVGANYIEANEGLSKKDFANRIKICRKEAKECGYWLRLVSATNPGIEIDLNALIQESTELMNILGAILKKVE
jgi:four helix bundle protein